MKKIITTILLISVLSISAVCAAEKGALSVPAAAKCPVCGMFVAKYPDWTASVRFKDGSSSYYDGPKDMFSHFLDTARYSPGKSQADIVALSVKEYYSLAMMDARAAFFVTGSDVYGPMGSELIPFKTEKDAQAFKLDHKGKSILRFKDVNRQTIKSLN
ncbi:MAG TPA: nitrous oxide reductase accessory protein NosL [Desulfuromonadales bacterium]|nr:nitrous oxide reductase accessory protein NosL [Desulfuromonadales bacterium]